MIKSFITTLLFFSTFTLFANVKLPVIFQNNMILQRDKPCNIWGWADKNEKIKVLFNGKTYQTKTNKEGKWIVTIPAQMAGGPYDISISGNNKIDLTNILFGDVWICGGQSNMQMRVNETGYKTDANKDNNNQIRIFTAHISSDYVPHKDLKGGEWKVANTETIQNFSAVGYFFGRFIQERIGVPIGLISDNLGATNVEAWMSPEGIQQFPQFETFYNKYLKPQKSFQQINDAFAKMKIEWEKNYYLKDDPGLLEKWYLPTTDFSGWKEMNVPGHWEWNGINDYDGSVWFQRNFDLPENFKDKTYTINLGKVDDYSIAWVNGHKIGESYGNQTSAVYLVPDSVLKKKDNTLVVRAFDAGGNGGMYNMFWDPRLAGKWKYKPGRKINATDFIKPLVVNADIFLTPSNLYNANIAPLAQLAIKGFIWYQGEGNAWRAEEYKSLFPAFIKDWRKQFAQGDVPFLFVQLANYMAEPSTPVESEWAELREAQASALSLPNTGIATAIDVGDAFDIHPKNKYDVGKRLGLSALKVAYGIDTVHLSPVYSHHRISGDSIIIHFKKGDEVVTKDKYGYIRGFTIAGSDKKFHWAKAYIKNNTVTVFSPKVKSPVAVRYAWADNPGQLDLYNPQGLPVLPFRTDDWKGMTSGKTFTLNG